MSSTSVWVSMSEVRRKGSEKRRTFFISGSRRTFHSFNRPRPDQLQVTSVDLGQRSTLGYEDANDEVANSAELFRAGDDEGDLTLFGYWEACGQLLR